MQLLELQSVRSEKSNLKFLQLPYTFSIYEKIYCTGDLCSCQGLDLKEMKNCI